VDSAAKKKHALGVLFIHGIGEQQRGDTLLRCAEPLADWLQKWSEGAEVPAPPSPTDTHLGPAHDEPAHTTLRGQLPTEHEVDWLLAESWWAETYRPPGPMAIAPWVWSVGKRVGKRQMSRFFSATEASLRTLDRLAQRNMGSASRYTLYAASLPLLLALFVVGQVFGWIVLAVVRVFAFLGTLSLLPLSAIPPLRGAVRRAQLTITNGVGDSWVLHRSPVGLDSMMTRIERDLEWLEQRAECVAVVAYSQGAVVAHQVLSARPGPGNVRLFITYGSALRMHYAETGDDADDRLRWDDLGPDGPIEWSDYYATWDPVCAGPVWRCRRQHRTSDPMHNFGSILADHHGYWRNAEQLVAGIASDLLKLEGAELSRHGDDVDDDAALERASRSRVERVSLLTIARFLFLSGAGTMLALLLPGPLADVGKWCAGAVDSALFFLLGGLGNRLGDLLDGTVQYYVLGALTLPACVALIYRLVVVNSWNAWTAKATEDMFRRQTTGRQRWQRHLFGLSWLVMPLGLLATWTLAGDGTWIRSTLDQLGSPFGVDAALLAWGYALFLFAMLWVQTIFRRGASLDPPPRSFMNVCQLRDGETKRYALIDHLGPDGIRCCQVRVMSIGVDGGRFRWPVVHVPAEERIVAEVTLTASGDRATDKYREGQVVVLHGPTDLLRWDEYEAWSARRDARHRPLPQFAAQELAGSVAGE
jgi:hypothetical protein